MSLIPCGECGAEISKTAKDCPKCGAVKPKEKIWPWILFGPFFLIGLVLSIGASVPEYERNAKLLGRHAWKLLLMISAAYVIFSMEKP